MTAIMSINEPRPRGTVLGERADWRRVREAEHYFARFAAALSTPVIWCALRITTARCRTRRKIRLSSSKPRGHPIKRFLRNLAYFD
jgi:hypothetical protein